MKSGATVKVILLFIGTLLLVQLLFFNMARSRNAADANRERLELEQQVAELALDRQFLQERLAELESKYSLIVSEVPGRILHGYDDQEQLLAGFLDYIGKLDVGKVEARTALKGKGRFSEKPVPVYKYDLNLDFSFEYLKDGDEFLSRVLGQDYYPLVVQGFDLHRASQKKITGRMDLTLHIPAKMKNPLVEISKREL